MNLQFLQDLENLSLDGEAFLAQFLEFLLDRSLENDVRFEPLIPMVAKVLDLRLPITTVTASFALLQATIRQNKIVINNSQNSNQTFPAQNSYQNSAQNQKSELNNSQISQNLNSANSSPNSSPNSNSNQLESLTQKTNSANSSPDQNQTYFAKTNLDISTNSDNFNSQNNSQFPEQNPNSQKENLQKIQENFQSVSLSEVHSFLIRQIGSSNEMSLKLLVSDLSIAKIDLEHQIGILTLSSGALLNFLKTKKSLDWIASILEAEFGWKLHLKAEQRESKTILFENTESLVVAKNSENSKVNSKNSIPQPIPSNILPNSKNNSQNNFEKNQISNSNNQTQTQQENQQTTDSKTEAETKTKNQNLVKTEKPKKETTETKNETKTENNSNSSSNSSESPQSVFYSLFWKGQKAPYNLQKVPIIQDITEPPKLDWEDLVADFEME